MFINGWPNKSFPGRVEEVRWESATSVECQLRRKGELLVERLRTSWASVNTAAKATVKCTRRWI